MKLKIGLLEHINEDKTIVIYDILNNKYFNLNETASIVYSNIDEPLATIVELISRDFHIDNLDISDDIISIIEYLKDNLFE